VIGKVVAPVLRFELWALKTARQLPILSGLWFWVLIGIGPLAIVSAIVLEIIDLIPNAASLTGGWLPNLPIPGWEKPPRIEREIPVGTVSIWVYPLLAALAFAWLLSLWQAMRSLAIAIGLSLGFPRLAVRRQEKLTRLLAAQSTS